jgi:hypothetical protein
MGSPNSFTIDRALFAPRPLSWAESAMALFRDFCDRVQSRKFRSRCEARLQALALDHRHVHPVVARPTSAKQANAGFESEDLQTLGSPIPLELA